MNLRNAFGTLARSALKRQLFVKNRILVGTHHKTGTAWLGRIFENIAGTFGLKFVKHTREQPCPVGKWDIFQNSHSAFDFPRLGSFRGLHMIRDPRDQVISATFYHQKSVEPWLHVKKPVYGGLTYQEKINSFSSFDDQLLFEMENSAYHNIMSMKEFDYSDTRFVTGRYEELITDYDLKRFERIFEFLGFRGIAMGWCLLAAYRNSLFSGAVNSKHVRSGKSRQWPEYFKPIHRQRFEELFGDILVRLGYDASWNVADPAPQSDMPQSARPGSGK